MALRVEMELHNGIARITLSGELDASVAELLREKIEHAYDKQAKRLVLMMQDLTFMSSAGLRVLVFARQRMGSKTDIYVVGAPPAVTEPIIQTGFSRSVILLDHYDAARIEAP